MSLAQRAPNHNIDRQEKRNKKSKRKFFPRKISGLVFLGLFVYMAFSFSQGFYQAYQLKQEIEVLEAQFHKVNEENIQLQDDLEYSQTPEAIEKLAREKLGLIKPGEIVIMRARQADQ